MVPYDNQRCVDAPGTTLEKRWVTMTRPNAAWDVVLCFCGIRLHQIGSLRCPAVFAVGVAAKNATPTAPLQMIDLILKYYSSVLSQRPSSDCFHARNGTLFFILELLHI